MRGPFGHGIEQRAAQRPPYARPKLHQRIQRLETARGNARRGIIREQLRIRECAQVDDLVAKRHAAAEALRGLGTPEHAKGKILNRKRAAALIPGWQPAADLW